MKNLRTTFAPFVIITLSIPYSSKSSGNNFNVEDNVSTEMQGDKLNNVSKANTSTIAFKDNSTAEIITVHLNTKGALIASTGKKVSTEANNLIELIANEKYNSTKENVQKIANRTEPNTQRDSFDSLSEEIVVMPKSSELISGNLFLQRCPVANGLYFSEEIRNPYFGEVILNCESLI